MLQPIVAQHGVGRPSNVALEPIGRVKLLSTGSSGLNVMDRTFVQSPSKFSLKGPPISECFLWALSNMGV